jgi:predicted DNA-binding transcriptional regulator YafY
MGNKNIYERFIWFDDRVRTKKYPNATKLSEQFEISLKTAQRDIEFMRERLCCPLVYDKNRKGYYYTDNTFSLPMTYISSEELSCLLIARKLLQDISGGIIGDEIKAIADKITSILRNHVAEMDAVDDALSFQQLLKKRVEKISRILSPFGHYGKPVSWIGQLFDVSEIF